MTRGTIGRVTPNAPRTPMKSFRIPEDLYRAALERAKKNGESLTDVVRRAFEEYTR
jgi:predicted CopG family antitoxin